MLFSNTSYDTQLLGDQVLFEWNIWVLGPDRNSGSGPVLVPVEFGPVPVPDRYRIFFFWIISFLCFSLMSYLHHVPPLVPWLHHVLLSSSMALSRAPLQLQFPDCITFYAPAPWLYRELPSSSQTVSSATLQLPNCITCPPPPIFPLATLG